MTTKAKPTNISKGINSKEQEKNRTYKKLHSTLTKLKRTVNNNLFTIRKDILDIYESTHIHTHTNRHQKTG